MMLRPYCPLGASPLSMSWAWIIGVINRLEKLQPDGKNKTTELLQTIVGEDFWSR